MDHTFYPAHIRYEDDQRVIQSVLEHLRGTEKLAVSFAAGFHGEADASLAALAHDIGKASMEFREHILHPELAMCVDHSTSGAQVVSKNLPAAFVVAGHHSGLPDGGNLRTDTPDDVTLAGRLKRRGLPDCSAWEQWLSLPPGGPPPFVKGAGPMVTQFYIRMLYSCLVDADYLDTERFMNPSVSRPAGWDLRELEQRLHAHTVAFYPPKGELNSLRCDVLEQCQQAGDYPKGLYTLTIPTGGGKTLSSLAFALRHAVHHGMDRVIYVVPYTSIIDQTARIFRGIFGDEIVLEHHSGVIYDDTETDQKLALASENWDMPIVVTTAVQFFESLYANRSSKCRKLHNISNAVLIFDEAQMIPIPFLQPCVFSIAELIRHYGATALLCTATQPALEYYFRQYGLTTQELYPESERLFSALQRTCFERLGTLSVQELSNQLQCCQQVLCVVNRRKDAAVLCATLPREGRYCLTTLLCPADRKRLLDEIRHRLTDGLSCRVVSTSLIEAGVDVDFPRAFRELAGLDSILQTAGRCNREAKRPLEESLVTVFTLQDKPPRMIAQNVDAARRTIKRHAAFYEPEAISEYFHFLRGLKGQDALDQYRIVDSFERGLNGCGLPFAKVAERFHLIDSGTHTVYIPLDEAVPLIEQLRSGQVSRELFRKLGQYGVALYPEQFQKLLDAGVLICLPSGDGILEDISFYDPVYGLQPDAEPDIDKYIM